MIQDQPIEKLYNSRRSCQLVRMVELVAMELRSLERHHSLWGMVVVSYRLI